MGPFSRETTVYRFQMSNGDQVKGRQPPSTEVSYEISKSLDFVSEFPDF